MKQNQKLESLKNNKIERTFSLFLALCCLIFITGCSSTLPSKSREIQEFIYQEKPENLVETGSQFVTENFPQNCRWEKVEKIVDGDTIKTNKSGKIRLIGIDTPEVYFFNDPDRPPEKGGPEATEKIRDILKGQEKICLLHDTIGDQVDKYDRSLDYVFLEDGTDINAEMLKTGFARWYSNFKYSRKAEFKTYQVEAQKNALGLWK